MSIGPVLLRALAKPVVTLPIAGGVLLLLSWWGVSAGQLARQIDRKEPTPMRFEEAVVKAKDDEIYVRIRDAKVDCDKRLHGRDERVAFALLDHQDRVAAMIPLASCDASTATDLVGVFRDPPYLLYGGAVAQGWNVTPGRLAFLETKSQSADLWLRVALSVLIGFLTIAAALSSIAAGRSSADEGAAWHVRAMGFAVLAAAPFLTYVHYDYVFFGFLPVPVASAIAGALALAMILKPRHAYVQKLTARF